MADHDEFFPNSDRVIYAKSPLEQVICQIRFPTILRIEAAPPADFQECVRKDYPIFELQRQPGLEQLPPEIVKMIGIPGQQTQQFQFISADRQTTISLSPDSLTVTSMGYTRWEHFEVALKLAITSLEKIYSPSFLTRIGLRYQNAVVPEELGIAGRSWVELVSENIVGELRHPGFAGDRLAETFRVVRAVIPDRNEGVLLQHGIAQQPNGERKAYIFDIDCYAEKQNEIDDAYGYLRRFNARARYAFRWCISDFLHETLGPQPVDGMDN